MERHGLCIVADVVGKKSERQLSRAATAVSPFESAGTVIPQVEAGIEGATVHGYIGCNPCACTLIHLHAAPPTASWTSSAVSWSGCRPSLSKVWTFTKTNLAKRAAMSSR